MSKIKLKIEISATPEIIFKCFEDPELMKRWIEGIHEFRYLDQRPAGVGHSFKQVNKMGGQLVVYDGEITSFEKPTRFGALVKGKGYIYQMDFFVSGTERASSLDYEGDLRVIHPILRFFKPLILFFCRRVFMREMKSIKKLAETLQ